MCHSLSTLASSSYPVVQAPCTPRVITGSGTNPITKHTIVGANLEVLTILAVDQQNGNGLSKQILESPDKNPFKIITMVTRYTEGMRN